MDQSVLAADADGNRYTFIIKAAASSMSPDMLSCYTKKINVHESLYLKSAKVLSHYENKGIKIYSHRIFEVQIETGRGGKSTCLHS